MHTYVRTLIFTTDINGLKVGRIFNSASCRASCNDSSCLLISRRITGIKFCAYTLHFDGRVKGKSDEKHSKATQSDRGSPFCKTNKLYIRNQGDIIRTFFNS